MLRHLSVLCILCFLCLRPPATVALEAPEDVLQRVVTAVRDNTISTFYQSLTSQEQAFLAARWQELLQRIAGSYEHQFNATVILLRDNQEAQLLEQILKHLLSYAQSGTQSDLERSLSMLLQPLTADNPSLKDIIKPLSTFLYKDLVITKAQLQLSSDALQKRMATLEFKDFTAFKQYTFEQQTDNLQQCCLAIKDICTHLGIPLQEFLRSIAISGHEIDINNRKLRVRFKAFHQQFNLDVFITRNGQDWSLLNTVQPPRLTP